MEGPGEPCDDYKGQTRCDEPGKAASHQEKKQGGRYEDPSDGAGQEGQGNEKRQEELIPYTVRLSLGIPLQGEEGCAEQEGEGHLRQEQRAIVEKGMG